MRSPSATFDLRSALAEEVTGAIAELNAAPNNPKAVHRCRVRLKRARALARVGRVCAPGLAGVFNETARDVMQMLAYARDLSALAESARTIAKKRAKKQAEALEVMAAHLDEARAALPPLNLEAVRANLRDLLALAQVWPEASPRQIEKGAERLALRARRACRKGRGAEDPAYRHVWRKREKDRLYAAQLLGAAWPEERQRRVKLGETLGEALGRERDVLLLIERLEADPGLAGRKKAADRALTALAARRARLSQRADVAGERLHRGGA